MTREEHTPAETGIHDLGGFFDTWYPDPVSVFDAARVRRTLPAPAALESIPHHLVIVARPGGAGTHMVDFHECPVGGTTVVHVMPRQVHRWFEDQSFPAIALVVRSESLPPDIGDISPSTSGSVDLGDSFPIAYALAEDVRRRVVDGGSGDPLVTASAHLVLRHVLRARREAGVEEAGAEERARHRWRHLAAFRDLVDESYRTSRSVSDYARDLGVSTKTLGRITAELTGQNPKQIIDARVALEAQRLLAHTDRTAGTIAHDLGFTEPTNFSKFFQRATGSTPTEFRRRAAGDRRPAGRDGDR